MEKVERLLCENDLYDIGSYGWLNADDADPEEIGHAMWQLNRPEVDHNALMEEHPVHKPLDEYEIEILTAGEDFCDLMKSSRLSIGLAIIWFQQSNEKLILDNSYFWMHYTDALLKLEIASDRIRRLLLIACTGKRFHDSLELMKQQCPPNDKCYKRYNAPFLYAPNLLGESKAMDDRLSQSLSAVPDLANDIYAFIDQRNRIVHELATRAAINTKRSAARLSKLHKKQERSGFHRRSYTFDPDEWTRVIADAEARLRSELDGARDSMTRWYKLLINASNHVFQIEYWSRSLREKQGS